MKLDQETIELLDYGTNISTRPQDFMEYNMSTEDQFIFDEEWDYISFTLEYPELTENYLFWFKNKMITMLSKDTATKQDSTLMHSMYKMLKESINKKDSFHENLWGASISFIKSLEND